jgi:hypothetical protein
VLARDDHAGGGRTFHGVPSEHILADVGESLSNKTDPWVPSEESLSTKPAGVIRWRSSPPNALTSERVRPEHVFWCVRPLLS